MRVRMFMSILSVGLLISVAGCPTLIGVDNTPIFESSAVVKWNEVALAAVRNGAPRPTVIARSLFIVHSAMYDAWAAYDAKANGTQLGGSLRRPVGERNDANKRAAVSYAAYKALLDQFPAYEANTGAFTRLLNDLGYEVDASTDTSTPAGVGNVAAQAVLDFRQDDGANEGGNYAQVTSATYPATYKPVNSADPTTGKTPGGANFDPNHWQPLRVPTGRLVNSAGVPIVDPNDPTSFTDQAFLTPHWGAVTPFALSSRDQFRPPAPPQKGSDAPYTDAFGHVMTNDAAWNAQFDEVLAVSRELTDERKVIAEYWADGPRSETPPGHWNAICHGVCFRAEQSLDQDVKLFFALTGALFDSSIAVWEAKREYDSIRPVSAIRHKYAGQKIQAWGGPNKGTQLINGEDWQPYQAATFVTPPFAGYPSGHSAFSASAAEVLSKFAGSSVFYDGTTVLFDEDFNRDGIPDLLGQHIVGKGGNGFEASPSAVVALRWNTYQDAADQAGISRIYGGIHTQDDDIRSRELGQKIGAQALAKAQRLWNGEE